AGDRDRGKARSADRLSRLPRLHPALCAGMDRGNGAADGGAMSGTLFTIGYEAAALPEVIGKLKAAGVGILVDVRAVAASRRPGFSKTILRDSLEAEGIAYEHLRGLGTPRSGRDAARKGRIGEMEAIFRAHMETPEA